MQDLEVKAFKNELRNYRIYQQRLITLQELIDFCFDMLPGSVHGLDPGKEPSHGMPNKEMEYRIRDEISHHERNLERTREKVEYIDEILNLIETSLREAIIDVYADGKPLLPIADKLFISKTGLVKRINKAIKEALDEI